MELIYIYFAVLPSVFYTNIQDKVEKVSTFLKNTKFSVINIFKVI